MPSVDGRGRAPVDAAVEIRRDAFGIPHVFAAGDRDLFTGFGYAMAQDRLWQLDYLRRRALGRLAEALGPEALQSDVLARTIGLPAIARAELEALPAETARLLDAFTDGANALLEESRDRLPIEFDLLGYTPQPFRSLDWLAVMGELRWYLSGRLPLIVIPELARRALGEGRLYEAFLAAEAGDETILPPGSYRPLPAAVTGLPGGGPDCGPGSNNWVVAPGRSASRAPLLASDPHVAVGALSWWYQVRLCGGSFDLAGIAYAGLPAVLIGCNPRVAWGITNNNCSQRDLYQERTDPRHPGSFGFDGRWEPAGERVEEIAVRGRGVIRKRVRSSRHGPIVDELLPAAARGLGPASLRWTGSQPCGWLTSLLAGGRADSCETFRAALRDWATPTLNVLFADVDGRIGYQVTGHLPVRRRAERGLRRGWDPLDEWRGVVPFDRLPALSDPSSGWIVTANNPPAPADYPYPLSCTSPTGYRARRIRQMLEERRTLSADDCRRMQADTLFLRAADGVPALLGALRGGTQPRVRRAAALLGQWDYRREPGSAAAAIFDVFFSHWTRAVVSARLRLDASTPAGAELDAFLASAIAGLALATLAGDPAGWFQGRDRLAAVRAAFGSALDELTERLGAEMESWSWARLHPLRLSHPLSGRGDLDELLGGVAPQTGPNATGELPSEPHETATSGAPVAYRMVTDLSDRPAGIWAMDTAGQSGHPGSPHYLDQLAAWNGGVYHAVRLDRDAGKLPPDARLILAP